LLAEILTVVLAHIIGTGLFVAAFGAGNHPIVRPGPTKVLALILKLKLRVAVQNQISYLLGQIRPGGIQADVKAIGNLAGDLAGPALPLGNFPPGNNRSLIDRLSRVDKQIGVKLKSCTQSITIGAHPQWGVEAEHLWG
jgi:hypothetical protein